MITTMQSKSQLIIISYAIENNSNSNDCDLFSSSTLNTNSNAFFNLFKPT